MENDALLELAKEMAGSWRESNFCWFDEPEDSDNWCIWYTHNRDSGILNITNGKQIAEEMQKFGDDVRMEHHTHWACGWVDGIAFRCIDASGNVTEACKKAIELKEALEQYPILDEEAYSEAELEQTFENIESACSSKVRPYAPDDWVSQCYRWFANNLSHMDSSDDQGFWPTDEQVLSCVWALGLIDYDDLGEYESGSIVEYMTKPPQLDDLNWPDVEALIVEHNKDWGLSDDQIALIRKRYAGRDLPGQQILMLEGIES